MTLWILWSIATSALVAVAAVALDRAASYVCLSRRHVWIGAIVVAVVAPLVLGLRRVPAGSRSAVAPVTRVDLTALASPNATLSIQELATRARAAVPAPSAESPRSQRASTVAEWPNAFATWSIGAEAADPWVIRAWILASSILVTLFATALIRLRVAQSRWTTVETELGRVLLAPDMGPAVVGFLRPRIVLPSWAWSVETRMRELLLRHELEHLRAGDTRTLLVAELMVAIYPWNAVLWWAARRLRLAIEMDCDARVVRAVGGVYEYASMLLAVGERYSVGLPLAASLAEPRSSLEARIDAMTAVRRRRPVAVCLPLVVVAAMTLATAAWAPRPDPLLSARAGPRSVRSRPVDDSDDTILPIRATVVQTPAAVASSHDTSRTIERAVARQPRQASADPKPVPPFAAPIYPEQLRREHIEGRVVLRLRTDTRGLPDTASIQIVESTNLLFTAAVRRALRAWRFDSAGQARLAFVFMMAGTESREPAGGVSPRFVDPITGEPFDAVVITARDDRLESPITSSLTAPGTVRHSPLEDSLLSAAGYLQRKQAGMGFFIDGKQIDHQSLSFSIPVTVAQAEAEGAVFPRADAPPDIQPFFQAPFAGTTARRCVVASEADDPRASGSLRSGEMIVRGRWNDQRGLRAGEKNKLLWAPLHGSALQGTPLVVRAARLGAAADLLRVSGAGLAHTPGPPARREFGYPTLLSFPTPGQWLVVATAGSDWGCFVLTVS